MSSGISISPTGSGRFATDRTSFAIFFIRSGVSKDDRSWNFVPAMSYPLHSPKGFLVCFPQANLPQKAKAYFFFRRKKRNTSRSLFCPLHFLFGDISKYDKIERKDTKIWILSCTRSLSRHNFFVNEEKKKQWQAQKIRKKSIKFFWDLLLEELSDRF